MNINTIQNDWSDIKAKIQAKWSKFNDNQLESFKSNLSEVAAQIQKTYGITKEQAEMEFNDFKATIGGAKDSLQAAVAPVLHALKPEATATGKKEAMTADAGTTPIKKATLSIKH